MRGPSHLMKEEISETRLDNGLTILTDRMSGVRSATLGFFVRSGARDEPEALSGMTHFIEHCVFKGTHGRTAKQIAIEQDRLGGNLDAFTTHEETGFAIKVTDDRTVEAFDLLADMLTAPLFAEADLRNEQRVIIEEMKMVEDSPEEYLGDLFASGCFPGHPLGRNIAGTPDTVHSFDRERTLDYHSRSFQPSGIVIAAAGNLDHNEIVELAGLRFRDSEAADPAAVNDGHARISAPILIEQDPSLEQAHMIVSAPLVSAVDPRRYAAELLVNLIGGGTSSRLWQRVREERGLAYSVGASFAAYRDCGLMSVFAGTAPEQIEEVLDIVLDEMRWIARKGVTADELDLAKQQTRASILLGLEDSAGRAAVLAHSEMVHGRVIPVEETLAAVGSVSVEDIHELVSESFRSEQIGFAAIGDLTHLNVTRDRLSV